MRSLFSEKILISNKCISGLMPHLIKKSWTVSILGCRVLLRRSEKCQRRKQLSVWIENRFVNLHVWNKQQCLHSISVGGEWKKRKIQIADNAIFKTVKNRNVCISRKQELVLAHSIYITTVKHQQIFKLRTFDSILVGQHPCLEETFGSSLKPPNYICITLVIGKYAVI